MRVLDGSSSSQVRISVVSQKAPTELVVDGSTKLLRQIVRILAPLSTDVANSFGVAIVLVLPRLWLPDCITPCITVGSAILPRAKVVALARAPAAEYVDRSPFRRLVE